MVKTEKRQLHEADGETKAGEDRQGGWDERLYRLLLGGVEVVR
jgi:hypothetical protein